MDILETKKNIHVLVGLPGVEEKDISLSCNGRTLEIGTVNICGCRESNPG